MPEYKRIEEMRWQPGGGPDWMAEWGREFGHGFQMRILDELLAKIQYLPLEDQNRYLNVVRDEILPIHRRFREAIPAEIDEAHAVAEKWNNAETGMYAAITKDYDNVLESLPTRYPDLWPIIKEVIDANCNQWEVDTMRRYTGGKVLSSPEDITNGPRITYVYGNQIEGHSLTIKSYQVLCSRLDKRSALQQQQTQLLEQFLTENGLQLPPEFATLQQQIDDLKRPRTEEELAQADADKGKDACRDASPLELIQFEGVEGSGKFMGVFQNKAKKFTLPPLPPPALIFSQCSAILKYLKTRAFIKPFMQRPTEEEAPRYSSVVTRHRDIPMLEHSLSLVDHYGTNNTKYMPRVFIGDLRLMVENYLHGFEEGSPEHNAAVQVENAVYRKLAMLGSLGEEGKKFFDEAVLPEFNDPEEDAPADDDSTNDEGTPVADATLITIQDDDTQIENLPEYPGENIESPRPRDPSSPSSGEDNTLDMAWKGMDKAEQYDKNVGNPTRAPVRHNTQQPGASSSAQPPRPSLDEYEPAEQPAGERSFYDEYDYPDPNADHFGPPPEGAVSELGADDTLGSFHPYSSDEGEGSASAHVSRQPAPRAPVVAKAPVIDLTSPQQRQATHTGSASNERARDLDDQDSSDDDAPLLKQRKTAGKLSVPAAAKGKAHASASASSSRKRRRDDSDADDDDDYVPEQPSKRQRKAVSKGKAPATVSKGKGKAPAIPASVASSSRKRPRDDDGDDHEPEQSSKRQKTPSAPVQAPVPQYLLQREDSLPPSPAFEPLTPEQPAADGHRSMSPDQAEPVVAGPSHQAAAQQPQPDPATTALGHTDQGTITVTSLHRLPKWRKKVRAANRPWVFGYSFGDQYGLYIMRCPSRRCPGPECEAGPEVFSKHPLNDNNAALHLQECTGEFGGGDDDTMVRQFCKQVISDDKKAVTIEWARKWNNDLIAEYGWEADHGLKAQNF